MNINDVKRKAEESNKYWKLRDGQSIKGFFDSEITETKQKGNDGKEFVKYQCNFTSEIDGQFVTKPFSGSAKLYQECAERAANRNLPFEDAEFVISRKGSGQFDTRYTIDCLGKRSGVPF